MPAPRQQNSSLRFALHESYQRPVLRERLHNRLADIRFKEAFLALTNASPRGRADFPARADNAIPPKGQDLRDFLQGVMRAAVNTGDATVIAGTQQNVTRFIAELHAQVMSIAPSSETPSLVQATVSATKETAEALAAMAEAGTTRCQTAVERAVREGQEAIAHIQKFNESALATMLERAS